MNGKAMIFMLLTVFLTGWGVAMFVYSLWNHCLPSTGEVCVFSNLVWLDFWIFDHD